MYLDDDTRLRHMQDAARRAVTLTRGRTHADVEADELAAFGLVKLIEIIGEAASKVSRPFRDAHPEIAWRQIIAMRHILVHDYDNIELGVVWTVVTTHLPELLVALDPLVPPWQESP